MSVSPLRRCEFCGESAHIVPLACPRITRLRYEGNEINIYFGTEPLIFHFGDFAKFEEAVSVEEN
jgi:hypothetical protein